MKKCGLNFFLNLRFWPKKIVYYFALTILRSSKRIVAAYSVQPKKQSIFLAYRYMNYHKPFYWVTVKLWGAKSDVLPSIYRKTTLSPSKSHRLRSTYMRFITEGITTTMKFCKPIVNLRSVLNSKRRTNQCIDVSKTFLQIVKNHPTKTFTSIFLFSQIYFFERFTVNKLLGPCWHWFHNNKCQLLRI